MATTTNYGWTTPDDTALVKDGASAIRSLGTSVDTTTKNLNPSTTLGDIEYRSSTANTNTRLGIGSTGQVLTVASGVPSWATASSGSFTLIATASPSAASTFEFTSIPSTYRQLFLVGNLRPSADGNGQNYLEFNGDTGSNYYYNSSGSTGAASIAPIASSSNQVHNNLDNGKDFSIYQSYRNYTATTPKIIESALLGWQYDNSAQINTTYIQRLYSYTGTSAISSIKFYAVSGTYTGTVSLYGQN
jgi:hypothetical protein